MRSIFSKRPSPAMAVAFVALLAALSGSAIALPGKNRVERNDIKKNAVVTGKVKNNNLRGADVRANTLTGSDINESTLGKVPSAANADTAGTANSANTANTANTAAAANAAVSANSLVGRSFTKLATNNDGGADVTMFSGGGFTIRLNCDLGDLGAEVEIVNTGAGGDDAHVVSDWVGDTNSTTIDEDDQSINEVETLVASNDADDSATANFSVHGENGTVLFGQAMATDSPDGNFASNDCFGSVIVDSA